MSALPRKRTFGGALGMSAKGHERTSQLSASEAFRSLLVLWAYNISENTW
jgi:hypothetical protein